MSTSSPLQPDPSVIGGISKAAFAFLPSPERLFSERAKRLDVLAQGSRLAPYLEFLAGLSRIQAELASSLPPVEAIPTQQVERARESAMPPLDRLAMAAQPGYRQTIRNFLEAAEGLAKPAAAAAALEELRAADAETMDWIIGNVMADSLPAESLAHHLYLYAATQVHASRIAARLDAARLVPIRVGICPVCGGRPVASMVVGVPGSEGARYGCCSFCMTRWNEVRIKCLACGSTEGIGYRAVEVAEEDATVKAEVCDTCHSWVKILYQNKNPSLEPIADDVASVGLDMLMKDTEYRRAGFNPFLMGY
ncbi:formate dehydrogenase accessory protein FdhE [Rhizobium sp. BK251]|uniref:formate dehydrogenase accessory protein FdhE n=1 Tax=Rhizobium sp. BK251 TaxID=2512125 RepID=UPI0010505FF1|nr:formate dehydrogenase accessory protein FdhE [Rhizobium sp. BK251]TCL73003.1 Tat proofreading chaperone FdhE [Rhizobium sp. BK251]